MRGKPAVAATHDRLAALLNDPSPSVRVAAAEALAKFSEPADLEKALSTLVDLADVSRHGVWVAMAALQVLDELDEKAAPVADQIRRLPTVDPAVHPRYRSYPARIRKSLFEDLEKPVS